MASRENSPSPSPAVVVAPGVSAQVGVGRVLGGRYRLEHRLAQGGMGTVFRATQLALGRHVAVKVLRPDYQVRRPRDFYRRFAVEARAAARLQHPHSVTVLDYGCEADGTYYLVMEYLRGKTLAQLLGEVGPMEPVRAVGMALQVGRAVQAAHATGIVHRDLKPANVMVLDWGEDAAQAQADFIKVLDFGLAKQFGAATELLTRTGQFLGSPGYMAPEQITGAELDGRCDVYALGAVLYQMLAGRPPFWRNSPHEVMRAHLVDEVPPLWPAGPGGVTLAVDVEALGRVAAQQARLEAVVRRALAKAPDARYPSMGKLLEALHLAIDDDDPCEGAVDPAISAVLGGEAANEDLTVARALAPASVHPPATQLAARAPDTVWLRPEPGVAGPAGEAGPVAPVADGVARLAFAPRGAPVVHRRRRLARGASAWLGVALWCALGQAPSLGRPGRPEAAASLPSRQASARAYDSGAAAVVAPERAGRTPSRVPDAVAALAAPAWEDAPTSVVGRGIVAEATEPDQPPLAPSGSVAVGLALHLDSTPRGAQVFVAGQRVCGATPCATTLEASASPVHFRFSLPGHDDTLVARRLPATQGPRVVQVHAKMR